MKETGGERTENVGYPERKEPFKKDVTMKNVRGSS